jgi:hypothetical protein
MQSPQNESGSRDVILDPEQIDAFHRHGFVVVPEMSDAAEVAKLTGIFDRMFAAQAGRNEGAQYDILGYDEDGVDARLPTLINPIDYERALRQLVFRSNALAVAQQLLGPKAVPLVRTCHPQAGAARRCHAMAPGRGVSRRSQLRV